MFSSASSSRVALVTGANGGIGSAIAGELLRSGTASRVFLGVHRATRVAEALAGEWEGRASLLSLDVTQADAWRASVAKIVEEAGSLEILVNAAGFHRDGLLGTMDDDTWSSVLAGNLDATFFGCRAVLRTMMAGRYGRIVNVASLSALLAPAGQTNYAAAKAGVTALTQALAKEVARAGITVNAVCPGYVETEAVAGIPPEKRRAIEAGIPMRRFGRPGEVANAVNFLASEAASYITGAVLKIDGGIF